MSVFILIGWHCIMQITDRCLQIFSKIPRAGRVKTRLIPHVGETVATDIYKKLFDKTLQTASQLENTSVQVWLDQQPSADFLSFIDSKYGFSCQTQSGKDLGQRMCHTLKQSEDKFSAQVIIGCDCPDLDSDIIEQAFQMLERQHDLVLGPARDGGYYLIGMQTVTAALFDRIKWGTETVLADTLKRAEQLYLGYCLLPELMDLDDAQDLEYFKRTRARFLTSALSGE